MRKGKPPAPSALLADMLGDYPHNERLNHLARDPVFRGKSGKLKEKGMNDTSSKPLSEEERFRGRTRRCHWNRELQGRRLGYQRLSRMTPAMLRAF